MRVYALVFCLLLGTSTAAMAQEPVFGVKGGVNFANLNFEGEGADVNFDRRTGFVGGLFMVWPGNSRTALQVEALFSQKGTKLNDEGEEGTIKLDVLDIPVLARFSSGGAGTTSFHVFGGPSFGFKLRARATGALTDDGGSEDIGDDVKQLDFAVVAGVGVEMNRITLDARQSWGLSNIVKDPDDDEKVKTRTFSVMLGIRF
jgi:outer membrane immunogenic protein